MIKNYHNINFHLIVFINLENLIFFNIQSDELVFEFNQFQYNKYVKNF